MNKTELQQKIVDMEKQLAELKKELEKKDKGIWKPEEKGIYHFIDDDSEIDCTIYTGDKIDIERLEFGNYFKTEEEATKMANYLKYTNLLRKYVEEHSEPLDLGINNQKKYYIFYDYQLERIGIEYCYYIIYQGTIYASSAEVLKEAISFVGEDNIKKYIFGIEE